AAERQAKTLAELLENLLADSRLRGDDPALLVSRVDVGPFVEEVATALRFKGPGRTIEARGARHTVVLTDRTLLYRVLINLGDNALKYSDGPVRITAGADGDGVRIEVSDRGEGISPEDLDRVFVRFERIGDGSGAHGTGLGLDLVRRATHALGGRVDVRSERGKGSTFGVWLPRAIVARGGSDARVRPVQSAFPVG
ncbi:MAG: HAMP domain-containing histidine kinase, partial [Actinobacteria bacterium]|nr:HAMP domain-containing histidine kinase [Actinomycetota bacterium]